MHNMWGCIHACAQSVDVDVCARMCVCAYWTVFESIHKYEITTHSETHNGFASGRSIKASEPACTA